MNFEDRFTERAKNALTYAQEAAADLGHGYVGTEHILLGVAKEEGGMAAKILKKTGLTVELITEILEKYVGRGESFDTTVQGLTPRAKRVIERAVGESVRLGHNYVGTEHLLLGILSETDCAGYRAIVSAGVDPNKIYTEVMNVFRGNEYMPATAKGRGAGDSKDNSSTKNLDKFSRDLTKEALSGKLDPVIGRADEIKRVIQILSRRTKNNPVLIGEPGVGKTAIAEGLAQKIVAGDVPETLRGKRVLALDLTGMVAGTKYRGDFEDRIKNVIEEVKNARDIILFIDELHTIIGAGAAEGAVDAANILKPALSRGEIQVVGATTLNEYRKYIEKDAALERRFQPVTVNEPTKEEAEEILFGLRDKYEAHHKLKITDEAIKAAVEMSSRYINDRFLPDKAIDLIDEAASRVRLETMKLPPSLKALETEVASIAAEKEAAIQAQDFERAAKLRDEEKDKRDELLTLRKGWEDGNTDNTKSVTEEDVANVVSLWTGIPVNSITEDESERLLKMESILHQRVVGQDEAVKTVSRAIRRSRVGLKDPKRPIGSFLFLGPTGVGKTELCKALAEAMFGDENAMIRIDMSEYMEKHTVSKLIGSPPGYVGYDEGGQLTEKVRRHPYSVVLFDEIEKANEDVFNIMLQIMDDGVLTDSQGRHVDFKNCIIVMTSNVGAKNITDKKGKLGFEDRTGGDEDNMSHEKIKEAVMGDLRRTFRPEFLNRIDDIIVFHQLTRENIAQIAENMIKTVKDRVKTLGITIDVDKTAVDRMAEVGFDPVYGARPLRRAIQSNIEDIIAENILEGNIKEGDSATVLEKDGKILVEKN